MAAIQVCFAVLCLIPCVGAYINIYTMTDYCGKSISMSTFADAIKLKLTDSYYYSRNMDCRVHIKYDSWLYSRKLLAQFTDLDVDCSDSVQLSSLSFGSLPGLGRQYCGETKPSTVYTTTGGDLYVQFKSDGYIQDNGFTMLINTFHTGICKSYEFECNNGRCLDYSLKRDGYDNCGDNSDERKTSYVDNLWWVWMIVGIVVFIVICVVITIICCCVCKSRAPGHVIKPGTHTVIQYQSGPQTIQGNPWYGPSTQIPQPQPMGVQPPAYTTASSATVYPPPQSAAPGWDANSIQPPPYTDKAEN